MRHIRHILCVQVTHNVHSINVFLRDKSVIAIEKDLILHMCIYICICMCVCVCMHNTHAHFLYKIYHTKSQFSPLTYGYRHSINAKSTYACTYTNTDSEPVL